jgi:protocatechuate 3,4-dioxygenase beta subunit
MNRPRYLFIILLIFLIFIAGADATKLAGVSKDDPIRNGVITGRVILEDGTPAEGARASIFRVDLKEYSQYATRQEFKTDSEGYFKATGLVPGIYRLGVSLPGYVVASGASEPPLYHIGEAVTINMVKGGVISGTVTDARGEPMIGEYVYACRVGDAGGRPIIEGRRKYSVGGYTDDRGVYRIFDLYPGSYVLRVNAGLSNFPESTYLHIDAPTYYPPATRSGAAEITVNAGEEITGVNIQHRSQPGHAVTGIVSGEIETGDLLYGPRVALFNINSGHVEAETNTNNSNRFVFFGLADGDYQLFAHQYFGLPGNTGASPVRIQVRSTDVTGIELKLFRYGSISGRVSIEAAKNAPPSTPCRREEKFGIEDIFLEARSDELKKSMQNPFFVSDDHWKNTHTGILNEKREFTLNNLESARYRIVADLPGENWYVRAINQPAPGATKGLVDASRAGIAVKRSEKISGVEVIIAEGAASLSGRLVLAYDPKIKTTQTPLSRYRVHLIPAESATAENLLRYAETRAGSDGSFDFKNLAPGKYWLLAKPLPESESTEVQTRPVAWDASERAKLRREAENMKNAVEIQPCQRVSNHVLREKQTAHSY